MYSASDKKKLALDPASAGKLFDALRLSLGRLRRDEAATALARLRTLGDPGRRAAANIQRHFEQLEDGVRENAALWGQPEKIRIIEFGDVKVRYAEDDVASRAFFEALMPNGRIHELGVVKLMLRSLSPGDIFVDVGAHTGYLSTLAGVLGSVVFAFELQPAIGPVIRRNAMINGLDQVHVFTAAAGARDGVTSVLRYRPTLSGRAFGESEGRASAQLGSPGLDWVPVIRLDTLAADLPKPPRLVKIDGEGSELQILEGARNLIAARATRFVLEFHVSLVAEFGGRREDLYPFFPSEHWRVYQIEDNGLRPLDVPALHALLDPVVRRKSNPNLLFDPITA